MARAGTTIGEQDAVIIGNNLRDHDRVAEGYMPPFDVSPHKVTTAKADKRVADNKAAEKAMAERNAARQHSPEGRFLQGLIRTLVNVLFRPKIYYINKEAQDRVIKRPCLIIGNHINIADGPLVGTALKGNVNYLAAGEMYSRRALARLLYDCGCIPIDRQNVDTQWIKKSRKAIKGGSSVCLFPEGGQHFEDFEIHRFKSGFVMIAMGTDIEILPVYIDGLYYKLIGERQRIMIGEPMRLEPMNGRNVSQYVTDETERFYRYELYLKSELERIKQIEKSGKKRTEEVKNV